MIDTTETFLKFYARWFLCVTLNIIPLSALAADPQVPSVIMRGTGKGEERLSSWPTKCQSLEQAELHSTHSSWPNLQKLLFQNPVAALFNCQPRPSPLAEQPCNLHFIKSSWNTCLWIILMPLFPYFSCWGHLLKTWEIFR